MHRRWRSDRHRGGDGLTRGLTEEQIAIRLPVWEAMANLFLDTDFDGTAIEESMIAAIAASPFTLAELDAIHDWEVAPAFASNLRDIAGEWAMWEDGEVERRIRAILPLSRWRRRLKRVGVISGWPALRRQVERRRATI